MQDIELVLHNIRTQKAEDRRGGGGGLKDGNEKRGGGEGGWRPATAFPYFNVIASISCIC